MSGNLKIIKKRIKSTKNIGQITKAMQMVAASKMKKAERKAVQARPYSDKIFEITHSLMKKTDTRLHQLLRTPKNDNRPLIILITTNRGLCGSLNLNLLRHLNLYILEKENSSKIVFDFISLGKKGLNFIHKLGGGFLADFSDISPMTSSAGPIINSSVEQFINKKNSSVSLAYNSFINAIKQEPIIKQILPLKRQVNDMDSNYDQSNGAVNYLIEPSAKEVLNQLLPFYLEAQVRNAILQAEASEYSARMVAMKNASDNSAELTGGLTLEYNKLRQQAVTTEISDIVTARISMEKK